ncbi:MAG: DNA polymerase I, partial [Mycoplasmataceae bacterium]|nr:DNA polymerase I [Mycoplasmataceae bacterium]
MKNKTLLIDGNSLIFRSFYATARNVDGVWHSTMNNSKGEPTNALRVFANVLYKAINDLKPDNILVAFDSPVKTFRHDFDFYKSKRSSTPDDLKSQFKKVKTLLDCHSIKWYEIEGLEADDIIGSACSAIDGEKYILTGDKDMFQLINDDTYVYYPDKKTKGYKTINIEEFMNSHDGLKPNQMIDLKSLMGDSSDNVPGVKGIGPKSAIKLLLEFNTLENLYESIENGEVNLTQSVINKLVNDKDNAFLSKKIVTIITNENNFLNLDEIKYKGYNRSKLLEFYNTENLYKLI